MLRIVFQCPSEEKLQVVQKGLCVLSERLRRRGDLSFTLYNTSPTVSGAVCMEMVEVHNDAENLFRCCLLVVFLWFPLGCTRRHSLECMKETVVNQTFSLLPRARSIRGEVVAKHIAASGRLEQASIHAIFTCVPAVNVHSWQKIPRRLCLHTLFGCFIVFVRLQCLSGASDLFNRPDKCPNG
jgi:hypothetical protein